MRRSARNRIKSPVVRIDLNSGGGEEETKQGAAEVNCTNDTDENIANLPEINNDSMMGDLNQLINDLNNGKSSSRGNLKALVGQGTREEVPANSSFDKQAKALYFDVGNIGNESRTAKTIDVIESEYSAGSGRQKQVRASSSEKMKTQQSKQKYIE